MTDDAWPGELPPHELRAIAGQLVDRDDGRAPGPSTFTASSPGLAPSAAAPPSEIRVPDAVTDVHPPTSADHAMPVVPAQPSASDPMSAAGGELRMPLNSTTDFGGSAPPDLLGIPTMDLAALLAPPGLGSGAVMSPPGPPQPIALSPALPATPDFEIPMFANERWSLVDVPHGEAAMDPEVERHADGTPRIEPADDVAQSDIFDANIVRRDFPILEERVHGRRLVWLDNAATTQKPRAVIDRLSYFYEHENSNVHRAAHALAARATDAYEGARETTRKFLNAPSASEIVFVRGATEGINLIAKTWGKRHVERGDEIVLTHLEHHANIVPWQQLCAEVGARLRIAPVDDRGDVMLDELERLMCSRTKIVSFTQVSNALGTVTPARDIIAIAHRWGATVVLDGAQAVSHIPVDVQSLDCDFYVFSGHKVFAPTGIGAVFGKRALLDAMPPWQGGGNMIADVTFERTLYQQPPWRFEAGTGSIADAAGMAAALDYVLRLGMPTIERYEHELLAYMLERLPTVPGLRLIGTPRERAGVVSFVLEGRRTEDVGSALDKYGIAVRSGHHCAQPILRRFGVESTVRASLALYNTREDIDALVAALRQL
jgi:cysteine desulfurase / selenocysteine lyase